MESWHAQGVPYINVTRKKGEFGIGRERERGDIGICKDEQRGKA